MYGKICFDISAAIILIVVILYHPRRNQARNLLDGIFVALGIVTLFSSIASVSESVLFINKLDQTNVYIFAEAVGFILLSMIAPLYVMYVVVLTGHEHNFYKNIKKYTWLLMPEIIWIFYQTIYYTGRLSGLSYSTHADKFSYFHNIVFFVLCSFYGILGLIYIRRARKAVSEMAYIVMEIPIVLTFASVALSTFFFDFQSVAFVVALCFLLLQLLNKASWGLVDASTGYRTQTAFAEEILSARHMDIELKLILIKVINYKSAISRFGYETVLDAVVALSNRISGILLKQQIEGAECFYNEEGSFLIMVPKKHFERVDALADALVGAAASGLGVTSDCTLLTNMCVVSFPDEVEDVDTVLMLFDDLGRAKHTLHPLLAEDIISAEDFKIRKQMNMIIDRALSNNYFSVYYQPIYSLKKDAFVSAEALIRLNDPEYGFISPGVFIPVAEKTGAIHKIGAFVFEEVCKFIASDEFEHLGVEYIEVNLSTAQCLRVNLVDEIEEISKKYGVLPKQINLEITETAECYSQDRLLENVRTLHNGGYRFSLDDFGTGYSNLMRMTSIPLEIVKLDRAFVLMDEDEKFHAIIKNMVRLFRQMGLKILVEGVETEEMVEKFRDIEVDYIQGFYYSKPIPKDDYVDFVRSHNKKDCASKF